MNPGIVLTSFTQSRSSPQQEESTRAIPEHLVARNAATGDPLHVAQHLRLQIGGDQELGPVLVEVLGRVVVELVALRHDLPCDRCHGIVVAEDRALDLAGPVGRFSTTAFRA